jgi:hypothetical protein
MTEVRQVDAGRGWSWIVEGYQIFKINPPMLIVLLLIYIAIAMLLNYIPIGSLIFSLLAPVFVAGFMHGCRALENGEELEINHLFAGFKHNTSQLVTVGGIYLAGMIIIAGIIFLGVVLGGGSVAALTSGNPAAAGLGVSALFAALIGMLLVIPLVMAYWFAPVLIAFHDISAMDAMKLSFDACLRNWLPFLICSLILTVLLVLAIIPFGLGLLVMLPVMITVLYTSYKDIFNGSETTAPA